MNRHLHTKATWPWTMVFVALAFLCQDLRAQTTPPQDALVDAAREIMAAAGFCALATVGDSNSPSIREMDPFPLDEDMTVWLGTNRNSRKVREIARNPKVALFYAAPDSRGYVTITGHAVLVDDAKEKASRWKPAWNAFYTDRESEYILIKVIPERVEVLDYKRGLVGDPVTWEAPAKTFR